MISLTKLKKRLSGVMREESAQAEAVFRLMIDSVIGLAILLVILSALSYFQGQVVVQSKADFISLVKNAVNSPTGIIMKSGELSFPDKFSVSTINLENWTNLSRYCFELKSRGSIFTNGDQTRTEFSQALKTVVYVSCESMFTCNPRIVPTRESECCEHCIVSFGLPINPVLPN